MLGLPIVLKFFWVTLNYTLSISHSPRALVPGGQWSVKIIESPLLYSLVYIICNILFQLLILAIWSSWGECTSQCIRTRKRICSDEENCEGGYKKEKLPCKQGNEFCFPELDDHLNGNVIDFFVFTTQSIKKNLPPVRWTKYRIHWLELSMAWNQ